MSMNDVLGFPEELGRELTTDPKPENKFREGDSVRVNHPGLSTDPGYESVYKQGQTGKVIWSYGYNVGVEFPDRKSCQYNWSQLTKI